MFLSLSLQNRIVNYLIHIFSSEIEIDKIPKLKTKGELTLEDLPPIENLEISVPEEECQVIGHILNSVETLGMLPYSIFPSDAESIKTENTSNMYSPYSLLTVLCHLPDPSDNTLGLRNYQLQCNLEKRYSFCSFKDC